MSDALSTSDLSARVKTGFPLAAGIAILLFTPVFVIGLAVMAVAFIGAQELTAMLSAKSDNTDTIVILPEWLLPGTAVLMGLGALSGESGLHGTLLICVLGWIFFELVFTPKSELAKLSSLGSVCLEWFGPFGAFYTLHLSRHFRKGRPCFFTFYL